MHRMTDDRLDFLSKEQEKLIEEWDYLNEYLTEVSNKYLFSAEDIKMVFDIGLRSYLDSKLIQQPKPTVKDS